MPITLKTKLAPLLIIALVSSTLFISLSAGPVYADNIIQTANIAPPAGPEARNPYYVPLRRVFEQAGGRVDWDGENNRINILYGNDSFVFMPNSKHAYKNDLPLTLHFPTTTANGWVSISYWDVAFLFEDEAQGGYLSETIAAAVHNTYV